MFQFTILLMRIQSKFRTLYKLLYTKYILNYINILEMGNENRFIDFFFFATPQGLKYLRSLTTAKTPPSPLKVQSPNNCTARELSDLRILNSYWLFAKWTCLCKIQLITHPYPQHIFVLLYGIFSHWNCLFNKLFIQVTRSFQYLTKTVLNLKELSPRGKFYLKS